MAGYSKTPLVKKLGIKENFKIRLFHPPENYFDLLQMLPNGIMLLEEQEHSLANFIHLFAEDLATFQFYIHQLEPLIERDGIIWVSWYKKASKIPTDLTEQIIRDTALAIGLVDVKKCAVDEKWSGLKLVIPKARR